MNTNEIKNFINKLTEEYIENHTKIQGRDALIEENNKIDSDTEAYHGREIFELLQNADDAYQKSINDGEKPKEELAVNISYKNGVLTVTNTGTYFDREGIKAIVQGNNSTKPKDYYIGNKGTGFRSLLNWATKIIINSGECHVEFSEEIAQNIFNQIKDCEQIRKQIKKQAENKKKELFIPMYAVPEFIDNCEFSKTTRIEITIDPQKKYNKEPVGNQVEEQLEEIDSRILLFLPNIHKININIKDNEIIYEKNITENNIVELKQIENNICQKTEEFFLHEKKCCVKDDNEQDKVTKLAVAVPVDFTNFTAAHLYSYFPLLKTPSPFNCILHANYELDQSRNTINNTILNKNIIKKQLDFLIEITKEFIDNHDFENAYNILIPVLPVELFLGFEVKNDYFDKLSSAKIFLTVNNELISIEDNPLVIEENYPNVFVGEHFSRLLKPIENENGKKLFKELREHKDILTNFEELDLLKAINASSENWDIENQVEVFVWWNKNQKRKSLPRLIKTQDGSFLEYKKECYFLTGNSAKLEFPDWVTIPIIDRTYQEILFSFAEEDPDIIKKKEQSNFELSRIISQNDTFPCVDFKYRDIHSVIPTVNALVDNFDKAVDFVNWLWSNYANNESLQSYKDTLNFPCIINGEKSFFDRKNIFYGKDYGNELGEQLFCSTDSFILPNKEYFNISSDNLEEFINFIKALGVKQYPAIEQRDITNKDIYPRYLDIYANAISKIENTIWITFNIHLLLINNLSEILKISSTKTIIKWIINDKKLLTHLSNPYESNGSKIEYKTNRQQIYRIYTGIIKNYILEIFNDTKWIKIGEEKFSPRDILTNSKTNSEFIGYVPVIILSKKDIDKTNSNKVLIIDELAEQIGEKKEDIEEVFKLFDFKKQVTDLSSDKFYEILLNIPNNNEKRAGELCREIYRIVELADFKKVYEDSPNKKLFFSKGEMFVKFHGTEQFHPANQSYLPSNTIINKKIYPIVIKGARTNNENFVRVFGCKKYERAYKIDIDNVIESEANNEFQGYFSMFKKYAKAFDNRNANLREHSNKLKITLAKEIPLIENNTVSYITDEYTYVNSSNTNWYIKINNDKFDINQLGFIIKDIYETIANTSGFEASKIRELFIGDKHYRELLIIDEFGSLDVIDDKDSVIELKNNFIKTIRKINPLYDSNQINIDFYDFTETNFKNSQEITRIFKVLKIDVDTFKNYGFKDEINLIYYFKKQLKDFIRKNEDKYRNMLYTQALHNEKLQKSFLQDIDNFINFNGENGIINSVNVCITDIIMKNFPAWNKEITTVNAEQIYQENYKSMNPENLYSDEISNDNNAIRMIYFNKKEEFEKWINEINKQNSQGFDKIDTDYTKFSTIIPEKREIEYSVPTMQIENNPKSYSSHKCFTESEDRKRRQKQKEQGNKGELFIYNYLCKEYGKDKVFPKSEAFAELEIKAPGLAKSGLGYDIEYKDENDVTFFVEVKTGHNNTFIMTPNELQFAKDNLEQYKLFYVFNLDKNPPDFYELPLKFWEDKEHYKRTDIIERFEIKFYTASNNKV